MCHDRDRPPGAAALDAFDSQLRRSARDGFGTTVERCERVVRRTSTHHRGRDAVEWSDLDAEHANAVIDDQIAWFSGRPFEWKYYSYDRPTDLPARLRVAGLVPDAEQEVMVAEVADLITGTTPLGIDIRPVTDDTGIGHAEQVFEQLYGGRSGEFRWWLREEPEALVVAVAYNGSIPVGVSRVDFHRGTEFASMRTAGTLPAWRGLGIFRAMVAHHAKSAMESGYRYLHVDALPTNRPNLEQLGFVCIATTISFRYDSRQTFVCERVIDTTGKYSDPIAGHT